MMLECIKQISSTKAESLEASSKILNHSYTDMHSHRGEGKSAHSRLIILSRGQHSTVNGNTESKKKKKTQKNTACTKHDESHTNTCSPALAKSR